MKTLTKLDFPELEVADAEYSGAQTVLLDFDGAGNVSYHNDALGININISSVTDSGLSEENKFQILTDLNNTFDGTGVSFTMTVPTSGEYSTIYVGGDGSEFSEYGSFLGLSETIDAGNQIKDDKAFVFSDNLSSVDAITETIAHETAHLIGYIHADDPVIDELSDFATVATLPSGTTKFTSTTGAAYDFFGYSVAVAGNNVIAGACGHDSYAGSVYSYRWNGTSYDAQIEIIASDVIDDGFGFAVDGYGDTIISGTGWGDGVVADSGAAYIYTWGGSSYTESKLTAVDGAEYDYFGYTVAISGDAVVVGAYGDDNAKGVDAGAAYVYHWDGDSYEYYDKLITSTGAANMKFGYAVAVSGDNIVVGSLDEIEDDRGAYVYRWNGSGYDEYILAPDDAGCCSYGNVVAIDGDIVAVSAYCATVGQTPDGGKTYVYEWNDVTEAYDFRANLSASNVEAREFFGKSIAVSGDYVVVGAYGDDVNGVASGSTFVYRWDGEDYNEFKFTAEDGSAYDYYGKSVDIDGTVVVVGAYGNGGSGTYVGSAYSFDLNDAIEHSSSDFNGSGKSDILLTDGFTVGYCDDGFTADWHALATYSPGWEVVGIADFDNNNKSDILFSDGTQMGYYADGLSSGWTYSGALGDGWEIKGTADFDGNGKDDILLTDGFTIGYYADGLPPWQALATYSPGWEVIETGDFDGNGKADVLFSDGSQMGYYADGLGQGWTYSGVLDEGWDVAGIGDFDGNGNDDILLTDGFTVGYCADGLVSGWQALATYSPGWEVKGVGNFDGNDISDILFADTNSNQIGYYADGLSTGWAGLGSTSSGWDIVIA